MNKRHVLKQTVMSLFVAILLAVSAAIPALAQTYNCGAYGASDYNENCPPAPASGGSSGGSSGGGTSTPAEPTTEEGDKIVLNDFEEFTQEEGKQLDLTVNQVIYFTMSDGGADEEHSILIKEIGADYIIFRFDGGTSDIRLQLGQTLRYDIDGDGDADIEITLNSINGVLASVTFRLIAQADNDDDTVASTDDDEADAGSSWWKTASIVGGILLILAGILWAFTTWRRGRSNPPSNPTIIHP